MIKNTEKGIFRNQHRLKKKTEKKFINFQKAFVKFIWV